MFPVQNLFGNLVGSRLHQNSFHWPFSRLNWIWNFTYHVTLWCFDAFHFRIHISCAPLRSLALPCVPLRSPAIPCTPCVPLRSCFLSENDFRLVLHIFEFSVQTAGPIESLKYLKKWQIDRLAVITFTYLKSMASQFGYMLYATQV